LTSSAAGDNANDVVRNNYSREDIGITLKVKPRLSSRNKVTLTVEANIEDVDLSSSVSADRPTTTKRKVNTNAIVSNGQTIILGGLIKSSGYNSSTKVPVLGDLPIIGSLFRSDGKNNSKINVVIYLTPYIVRKSSDLIKLKEFLAKLNGVQKRYNRYIHQRIKSGKSTVEEYDGVYQPDPEPVSPKSEGEQDAMRMLGFKHTRRPAVPAAVSTPVKKSSTSVPRSKKVSKKTVSQNDYVSNPAYVTPPPSPTEKVVAVPEPTVLVAPQEEKKTLLPRPIKKPKAKKTTTKTPKVKKETPSQKAARLKREAFEKRKLERKKRWEERKLRHEANTPRERRSRTLRERRTPHSFMREE